MEQQFWWTKPHVKTTGTKRSYSNYIMGLMPELGENSQNSLEKLSLEKTLKSQIYNGIPGNKESKITPAIRSQIISHIWKKGIQS